MHKLDRLILETFASTSIREENKKPDDLPKAFIAAIEKRYGPVHERDFFNDDLSRYMKFSSEDKESGSIGHTVINILYIFVDLCICTRTNTRTYSILLYLNQERFDKF